MSKARKPAATGIQIPALVRNNSAYKTRVEDSIPASILNCIVTTVLAEGKATPRQKAVYDAALTDLTVSFDDHFRDLPWPVRKLLIEAVDGIVRHAVTKNGVSMCTTSLILAGLYWMAPVVEAPARRRAVMNAAFLRAFPVLLEEVQTSHDYETASDEAGWIAEVIRTRLEGLRLFAGQPQQVAA